MFREKTNLEKSETHQAEASRLRYALHVIHGLDDLEEAKRVAWAAMRGEKHGHEMPEPSCKCGITGAGRCPVCLTVAR